MYGIEGADGPKVHCATNMMCVLHLVISAVTLLLVVLMIMGVFTSSPFENNDYGIGQRRDVIAAIPVYEEESLQQKVDRWTSPQQSNLTGSRDPPVFFQDYDADASRQRGRAVSVAREGFEGGRDDNDLERALSGH